MPAGGKGGLNQTGTVVVGANSASPEVGVGLVHCLLGKGYYLGKPPLQFQLGSGRQGNRPNLQAVAPTGQFCRQPAGVVVFTELHEVSLGGFFIPMF